MGALGVAGRRRRRVGLALGVLAALALGACAGLAWAWPRLFPDPLAEGRAAYGRRDWGAALASARRALKGRPGDREALRLMARADARLGRIDAAQAIYERLGPDSAEAEDLTVMGLGLKLRGETNGAYRSLEAAVRADPDHPEALQELGRMKGAMDRLAEATDLVDRLAKLPGQRARAALLLGLIRHEQSDPSGAASAFEEALRLDPTLDGLSASATGVRKLLARDLLRDARPAEALATIREALAGGPDPEASWLLSRAFLQQDRLDEATAALEQSGDYRDREPQAPEPAPYLGAARCAECHAATFRRQQDSRHARTFFRPDRVAKLPWPDHPVPDPADESVAHEARRRGGEVTWETRAGGRVARALIDYAFGSGDRGVTPVGRDEHGRPREIRLSHYRDIDGWDKTTGHPPKPEHADADGYLGEVLTRDALRRCVGCHTTDAFATLQPTGPLSAERGIGCEKCHGPGGHHLDALAARFPDPAIGRPRLADAAQVTALCSQCHSPKGRTVVRTDPLAVRFQGTTLTWSRCYTESRGGLSCVTCHDPHRDAETDPAHYEAKCLACHADSPGEEAAHDLAVSAVRPRVSCPVNRASDCLRCHMPATTIAVPHTSFTDHNIRVHREDKTAE